MSSNGADNNPLIKLARERARSDPVSAKAWLLTARAVCPDNFSVQFEGYNVEKLSGNAQEAGKCLSALLPKYVGEAKLQSELLKTVEAAHLDLGGFYNAMFNSLGKEMQYKLLLTVADVKSRMEEKCKLMVFAISHYPNLCQGDAVEFVDKLLQHVDVSRSNKIRAILVCQIMPLVLELKNIVISSELIRKFIETSLRFYLHHTSRDCVEGDDDDSTEYLGLPVGGSGFEVWSRASNLLAGVDRCRHWAIHDHVSSLKYSNQLEYLVKAFKEQGKSPDQKQAIFYYLLVLLLKCVYEYISITRPDSIVDNVSLQTDLSLVMVEVLVPPNEYTNQCPPGKRRKLSDSTNQDKASKELTVSEICLSSDTVATCIEVAVDCWQFIHSHPQLETEFNRVSSELRLPKLNWFTYFQLDFNMYRLDHKSLSPLLTSHLTPDSPTHVMQRVRLQMAVSCLHGENYQEMCEHLVLVLDTLSPQNLQAATSSLTKSILNICDTDSKVHHLHLLALTDIEILHYSVHLITHRLKSLVITSPQDDIMGHMLVLGQLDWPVYLPWFEHIISLIQEKRTFKYNMFFLYLIVPNILEEFCFLKTSHGGKIDLDVMPVTTAEATKQRTMTRGADREVREDFNVSMEKQVMRCREDLNILTWSFIGNNSKDLVEAME